MSEQIQIIGLAGPAGAGKGEAASMMDELYGAEDLSTSDVVRTVARHIYRLPPDIMPEREQLLTVGEFLRTEVDPAFTVKICLKQAQLLGIRLAVISGLAAPTEADEVRAHGGIIVGVDAEVLVRYGRIVGRARDREPQKTFAEFLTVDERANRGASNNGIQAVLAGADVVLDNGLSRDELRDSIRTKVGPLIVRNLINEL